MTKKIYNCAYCERPFRAYACHRKRGGAKYCSNPCRISGQADAIKRKREERSLERKKPLQSLSASALREILSYDAETGQLLWLPRSTPSWFNSRIAGKPALTSLNSSGYRQGLVFKKNALAHRVAWAIYYGEWPDGLIDHINGDRADNRIANLRVVTPAENVRNSAMPSTNRSGVVGVCYYKQTRRWMAYVGKRRLGYFKRFEDAVAAREDAARGLFSERHGKRRASA